MDCIFNVRQAAWRNLLSTFYTTVLVYPQIHNKFDLIFKIAIQTFYNINVLYARNINYMRITFYNSIW